MPGRNKKSGSGRKKNKSNRSKAAPIDIDVDAVLAKADEAMVASDVQTALGLYTYACGKIRERIDGGSVPSAVVAKAKAAAAAATNDLSGEGVGVDDDDVAAKTKHADVLLLSKTLGKCGEARVSLGDQEGGREAFLEAISLLDDDDDDEGGCDDGDGGDGGRGVDFSSSSMDEDGGEERRPLERKAGAGGGETVADAQFLEAKAGLHLYLGQLSEGEEALSQYAAGVADLRRCAEILESLAAAAKEDAASNGGDMEEEKREGRDTLRTALSETRRQLCGAHCSVAELYLTDLCFDPEAESRCEDSLRAALEMDDADGPPDALQGMANLRLSQARGAEATRYVLDAYARMKVGCEAMSDLVGLGKDGEKEGKDDEVVEEQAKELVDVDAANSLPGFEFRCQTAKILLECAAFLKESSERTDSDNETPKEREQGSFCAEAAVQVLGSLLAENDEVVEVWYLLGCAFASSTPPNNDLAQYYWETALEMLNKVKKNLEDEVAATPDASSESYELSCQLSDVTGQIEEVTRKIAESNGNKVSKGSESIADMDAD